MKLLKKKYIRLPLIVAVIAAIVLAGINQVVFSSHQKYANTVMEFVYDGAEKGFAPNGELFSIDNIKNDANLEEAINASGLEISVKEFRDNIVIQGVYPNDLTDHFSMFNSLLDSSTSKEVSYSDYNPTKFSITLNDSFEKKLSKTQLVSLFDCLIGQYKSFFSKTYSAKIDWNIVENTFKSDNQDYSQRIENMKYEVSLMKACSDQLSSMDNSFEFEGISFSDFSSSCASFDNNTLSSMLANISLNGISKDLKGLERKYSLELDELYSKKAELTQSVSDISTLVSSYSKDSTVYLSLDAGTIEVKSNSNATYEKLIEEKKTLTQDLITVNSQISKLEENIDKIKGANSEGTNSAVIAKLETNIESAQQKLDSLKEQFASLCDAFNKEYASEEVIKVSDVVYGGGFSITSFVKQCIKYGIVTVGLAVVYILCVGVFEEFRKKKGNY